MTATRIDVRATEGAAYDAGYKLGRSGGVYLNPHGRVGGWYVGVGAAGSFRAGYVDGKNEFNRECRYCGRHPERCICGI